MGKKIRDAGYVALVGGVVMILASYAGVVVLEGFDVLKAKSEPLQRADLRCAGAGGDNYRARHVGGEVPAQKLVESVAHDLPFRAWRGLFLLGYKSALLICTPSQTWRMLFLPVLPTDARVITSKCSDPGRQSARVLFCQARCCLGSCREQALYGKRNELGCKKVTPHVVRISTPKNYGTAFVVDHAARNA